MPSSKADRSFGNACKQFVRHSSDASVKSLIAAKAAWCLNNGLRCIATFYAQRAIGRPCAGHFCFTCAIAHEAAMQMFFEKYKDAIKSPILPVAELLAWSNRVHVENGILLAASALCREITDDWPDTKVMRIQHDHLEPGYSCDDDMVVNLGDDERPLRLPTT